MKTTTTRTNNKNGIIESIFNFIYVSGFIGMFIFTILQIINN